MSTIKNGGLDQYGAEPFEQQQFGTAGVEGVKHRIIYKVCVSMHLVHTGNSLSYLSDLVTTTADIPSRMRLRSARIHRFEPLTTRLKFGERCFS